MQPSFRIDIDPDRSFLTITLAGFFAAADVDRFGGEKREVLHRMRGGGAGHRTLCDVSACVLQSQEIVAAFGAVIADTQSPFRRLAIVTGSSLARMQVRRLLNGDDMACFADRAEAEAWLFAA